ncbi:hypothetical protein ACXIHB_04995 [Tenacibaculum sp. IMCC1]|uniref:Uncharacterized protein n=1 Tax=Tenacibaculum sp. Pbs-1 TaxID=3238748 RepID=A0AB33KYE0_9FLAO
MKKIYLLFIILSFFNCSSLPKFEELKNKNTLFIYLEKSSDENYKNIEIRKKTKNYKGLNYLKYEINGVFTPFLKYSDYENFNDMLNKTNKSIVFYVNKSFLQKNKDIIITQKLIDKVGVNKVFKLLGSSKNIFLIDKKEIKGNKVLVRQVKYQSYAEE